MSGFIYFIPGIGSLPTRDWLFANEMEFFQDNIGDIGQINGGPGEQNGFAFSFRGRTDPNQKQGYFKKHQKWNKFFDGKLWVGYDSVKKPNPEFLKRKNAIPGYKIKLGDGNEWEIPIARRFDIGSLLPTTLYIGSNGKTLQRPIDDYLRLSKYADMVYSDFEIEYKIVEGTELDFKVTDFDILYEIATECLSTNYNIGRYEISCLGLLQTNFMQDICNSLIDMPFISEAIEEMNAEKKK